MPGSARIRAGGLDAVQSRQRGVEKHDIRAQPARLRDHFLPGRRLADDADAPAGLQQRAKAGADERLTVGDQHPDGRCRAGAPVETGARLASTGTILPHLRRRAVCRLRADHS